MFVIIAKLMMKAGFLFIFLEKTKQKIVLLSNRFSSKVVRRTNELLKKKIQP